MSIGWDHTGGLAWHKCLSLTFYRAQLIFLLFWETLLSSQEIIGAYIHWIGTILTLKTAACFMNVEECGYNGDCSAVLPNNP